MGTLPNTKCVGTGSEELLVDETMIHIVWDWCFSLRGGSYAQGIAHTGFPYAGPLCNVGALPS